MDYAWTCGCCGKQFNQLPLDFGFNAPAHWHDIPEAERATRAKLDADFCFIGDDIFTRGCLEIPIIDYPSDVFVFGVWTTVSRKSYERIMELWEAPVIENEPPLFGWFCNNIKGYPSTIGLKTHLHPRAGGMRHKIELEPTDHPLVIEQRQGITLNRVKEIAALAHTRH